MTPRSLLLLPFLTAAAVAQTPAPTPWPLGAFVPATIANDTAAPLPYSPSTPTVTNAQGAIVAFGLTVGTVLLLPPGETYTGYWSQLDSSGVPVAPGVYFVQGRPFAIGASASGLTTLGAPHVGVARRVELAAPSLPNAPYVLAAAFGSTTGFPLGCGQTFPLDADALFGASLGGAPLFPNFAGVLGVDGRSNAPAIVLPSMPWLVGITIDLAFVAIDPAAPCAIGTVSPVARTTIV